MNAIDAIRPRKGLGGLKPLRKLETWANRTIALRAVFALPMDEAELEVFRRTGGLALESGSPTRATASKASRRLIRQGVSSDRLDNHI